MGNGTKRYVTLRTKLIIVTAYAADPCQERPEDHGSEVKRVQIGLARLAFHSGL